MKKNFALLCIDLQREYFEKEKPLFIPGGAKVLKNVIMILTLARKKGIPIIHIKHISNNPADTTFNASSPLIEFMPQVAPQNEYIITKSLPGAFSKTGLNSILKSLEVSDVVICGLTSFLCCDTTSREAYSKGYSVYFIKDATAALDLFDISAKEIHRVICAIQKWYFAKVVSTKQILKMINTIHL